MIAETCLALAIYFEARNQPVSGQMAVAEVVLNRANHPAFPNDICSVVKQGPMQGNMPAKHKCQFLWYCDGMSDTPKEQGVWNRSMRLARLMIETYYTIAPTLGRDVLYFHSGKEKPKFFKKRTPVAKIGDHIFYR